MHYQTPHPRGFGGFVVLPIKPKPEPVQEPRATGWLSTLLAGLKAPK
ncbi:hypothetical protein [Brevundimonas sp.]|nr:hypothetical protein [Brevundimonas sp.]